MNNRLLPVILSEDDVAVLMAHAARPDNVVHIDVAARTIRAGAFARRFALSALHHRMFMQGTDMIGLTLGKQAAIEAFERAHHARSPWIAHAAEPCRARRATMSRGLGGASAISAKNFTV